MRILLVNQHYPPDSGATGKLVAQLAGALALRGHEVSVVTGRPTYREARGARAPREELREGVRVLRLPLMPRWHSPAGRLAHYLSFALALLARGLLLARPDVLIAFSSTPLFGGAAAALLARRLQCRFVYVVEDVYPEIAVELGVLPPGRLARLARRLDAIAWRAADRVVLIGEELAGAAAPRGVPRARLVVIPNWADVRAIRPVEGSAFRRRAGIGEDEFVVEYAGNFGRLQDLDTVLEAARIVEESAARERRVRFLLVGSGGRAEELRRAAERVPAVTVVATQPEERLAEVLGAADLSLVPLRAGLARWCVPSKVYSILASGRPVGAALDGGNEVARLVEHGACGFRVDAGDAEALAREILRLAADPEAARRLGRRARAVAQRRGSLERAVASYEALIEEIAGSSDGASVPTNTEGVRRPDGRRGSGASRRGAGRNPRAPDSPRSIRVRGSGSGRCTSPSSG